MEVGHSCTPGEGQKQSPVMGTLPRRGPAEPMERLSESGHLGPQKEGPGRRGRGRQATDAQGCGPARPVPLGFASCLPRLESRTGELAVPITAEIIP